MTTLPLWKTGLIPPPKAKSRVTTAARTPFNDFVSFGEEYPEEVEIIQPLSPKWLFGDYEPDRKRRRTDDSLPEAASTSDVVEGYIFPPVEDEELVVEEIMDQTPFYF
ncbi:hypothetical protein BSKO_13978 [Bryopsis sp. KO-2023]|nr:hypothetical protein BSKO_13978 [Bryopsis sp. KO-2023]